MTAPASAPSFAQPAVRRRGRCQEWGPDRKRGRGRAGERGAAMLMVLVAAAALTVVAGAALRATRASSQAARLFAREVAVEEMGRAGVDLAVAEIARRDERARLKGRAELALGAGTLAVDFVSDRGRVDLNHGAPQLLQAVFLQAGLRPDAAKQLADAILSERSQGAARPSGQARFTDPAELLALPGVTPALFAAVEPLVSPCSGDGLINPAVAPPLVLDALMAGDAERARRYEADHREETAPGLETKARFPAAMRPFVAGDARMGEGLRLRVEARLDGLVRRYQALICAPDGVPAGPFVTAWRQEAP